VVATVVVTSEVVEVVVAAVEVVTVPATGAQAANESKPARARYRMSASVRPRVSYDRTIRISRRMKGS